MVITINGKSLAITIPVVLKTSIVTFVGAAGGVIVEYLKTGLDPTKLDWHKVFMTAAAVGAAAVIGYLFKPPTTLTPLPPPPLLPPTEEKPQ